MVLLLWLFVSVLFMPVVVVVVVAIFDAIVEDENVIVYMTY